MKINRLKCNGCRSCKNICPVNAIIISNRKAKILQSKCIKCGACMAVCPRGAING